MRVLGSSMANHVFLHNDIQNQFDTEQTVSLSLSGLCGAQSISRAFLGLSPTTPCDPSVAEALDFKDACSIDSDTSVTTCTIDTSTLKTKTKVVVVWVYD